MQRSKALRWESNHGEGAYDKEAPGQDLNTQQKW
jgi:hypothetical protein